jgi:hypothetical protein
MCSLIQQDKCCLGLYLNCWTFQQVVLMASARITPKTLISLMLICVLHLDTIVLVADSNVKLQVKKINELHQMTKQLLEI